MTTRAGRPFYTYARFKRNYPALVGRRQVIMLSLTGGRRTANHPSGAVPTMRPVGRIGIPRQVGWGDYTANRSGEYTQLGIVSGRYSA